MSRRAKKETYYSITVFGENGDKSYARVDGKCNGMKMSLLAIFPEIQQATEFAQKEIAGVAKYEIQPLDLPKLK